MSLTSIKSFIFNSTFGVIHCNVDSQSRVLLLCYADEYESCLMGHLLYKRHA